MEVGKCKRKIIYFISIDMDE